MVSTDFNLYGCGPNKHKKKETKENVYGFWIPDSPDFENFSYWASGTPRLTRPPRPGPCLDFGFQYALIRNNRSKINSG